MVIGRVPLEKLVLLTETNLIRHIAPMTSNQAALVAAYRLAYILKRKLE